MFWRLWVRIPALHTGWTFSKFIRCENCNVCLTRPKINGKEAGMFHFLQKDNHLLGVAHNRDQEEYKIGEVALL